jgi:N-glycosylase/DNA lyase
MSADNEILLSVRNYDLAATLDSGQVFRWQRDGDCWNGVVGRHFLRLTQTEDGIQAQAAAPVADWTFLREFLQSDVDLDKILRTFPDDLPMRAAVASCRGLRLLRQEPWECLASFILSSTKQIVQIRQIISLLCERFGERISLPPGSNKFFYSFPAPYKIAGCSEAELRDCKMGFRAPGLLHAARQIAEGKFDLEKIRTLEYAAARPELMTLRGVGGKIADCVLLFAYGFDSAFPVDVWVERALQQLYFSRRRATHKRLLRFAATHFGPHAGYAQQYLFHYVRVKRD